MPKKKSAHSKKRTGSPAKRSARKPAKTPVRKKPSRGSKPKAVKRASAKAARRPVLKAARPTPPKVSKRTSKRAVPLATASQILNLAGQRPVIATPRRVPSKWTHNYRNLLRLREDLLVQSGQLVRDVHEETIRHSMHMADSGTDSFDRDFALSLLSADQEAIREIDEAISRIENGTYGVCELTGRPIAQARLDAIPWTRFSYEAQSRLEKEGVANHTQLGSLGSVYTGDNWETTEAEEEPEEEPAGPEKS